MERADFDQWKPKEVARLLALVETERRYYQEIVANLPVSLVIVGSDLKILSSNRNFRAYAKKKNDEILGADIRNILPVEGAADLALQVVGNALPAPALEGFWSLGEQKTPVIIHALPLRSWEEDSETEALLVIQEKRTSVVEAPRTPQEIKSVSVSEEVGAMLWEADLTTGKLTHVNRQAEALFGYPTADWLANEELWTDRVAPADRERVRRFYASVHDSEASEMTVEFQGLRADGSTLVARESIRLIRSAEGQLIRMIGCTTDVSQRREMEDQHAAFLKGEALHRLSAKLAHDLNNLLMIVAGYGEELKNALPATNPLHNDMREILEATQRLYAVTTQLQTYTRRPAVSPRTMDLHSFLDTARPALERALGNRVELCIDCAESLPQAKLDPGPVENALVALAQHIYLELGGAGTVSLHASPASLAESTGRSGSLEAGDYIRLTLSHSGTPMSPEARERLLEPWLYSEDSVREVKLGLAGAYQTARQSGGDIRVDAAGFHFYLPALSRAERAAAQSQSAPVAEPPAATSAPASGPQLETILVVEDEGGIRALVRKILRRQGYQVLEASHGEEALAVMAAHSGAIDLLLTDVMMPGMNGVDLSYKAVAARPDLRVLFVSGYTDESLLEAGEFPQGTAFLQKPFTLASLLGKVREVLDSGKSHQANG